MKITINYKTYGNSCCASTNYCGDYYPAMADTWDEARSKLLEKISGLHLKQPPPPPEEVEIEEAAK